MTYRTFDGTSQEETIVDGRFSSSGDIALADGTATQGAIYFADDKNTGIYSPSNDSISFTTAGTPRLDISSDGKIGVNTTPANQLHVHGGDETVLISGDAAPTSAANTGGILSFGGIYHTLYGVTGWSQIKGLKDNNTNGNYAGYLSFETRNQSNGYVEALKLDSDQNATFGNKVWTGHSGDSAPDGFPSLVQIDSAGSSGSLSIGRHSADSNGPSLLFHKSRAGATNGNTTVQKGDSLGLIRWYTADGDDRNSFAASISCENDQAATGAAAGNRTPGRLVFQTTKDEASAVSSTTALTIDSSQNSTFAGHVIMAASKGIEFSHYGGDDSNAATTIAGDGNLLDDYEEGTFTPNFTAGAHWQYGTRAGHYVKIGNTVWVSFMLIWSSQTTDGNSVNGTTELKIGGLPFEVTHTTGRWTASIGYTNGINAQDLALNMANQYDLFALFHKGSGTAASDPVLAGECAAAGEIIGSGYYVVA